MKKKKKNTEVEWLLFAEVFKVAMENLVLANVNNGKLLFHISIYTFRFFFLLLLSIYNY